MRCDKQEKGVRFMFEMSEEIQGGAVRNLHKDVKGEENVLF